MGSALMPKKSIYRIIFHSQGSIYELYAREVTQGAMFAFVEIGDIIFGERSKLVVDPSDEKLKTEFDGVKRTYIPLHAIVRIDQVEKEGRAKIRPGHLPDTDETPDRGISSRIRRRICSSTEPNPGTTEAAVPSRIFRKILLVVILGVVKRRYRCDLSSDRRAPGCSQGFPVVLFRFGCELRLVRIQGVNAGTVLGTDVISLAHPLSRIVSLPEHAK